MSSKRENEATAGESGGNRDQDRERKRRDWLVFLLILLLGFICLLIAAQLAVKPERVWQVYANMLSELNPDATLYAGQGGVPPLRPEVLTPPSWDPRYILTPVGTLVAVLPGTLGPAQTATPTPQEIASPPTPSTSVTPSPSTTPTQTPTGSPTATPTATPTGTPTSTPTGTSTPTASPTATSAPTATPEPPTPTRKLPPRPPTDTPPPSETPTPTDTPTPTLTPPPPPIIFSITPNQGANSASVTVTILGANFVGLPVVTLGDSATIAVSAATTNTITGTVPAGLTPGVYALTVRNPDLQYDRLSPAYVVLNVPSPNTTLETGFLAILGSAASPAEGDDDHVQVIFFEVPDGTPGNLYVRIFDADTGGAWDEERTPWDTMVRYTLRGGTGAYSEPDARTHRPGPVGINSGASLLAQTVIGEDTTIPLVYDNLWGLVFGPYTAGDGEPVGGRRVFKLVVEGVSGDDGNYYNAVLSTAADDNVIPAGSRVFAYAWTLPLEPEPSQRPPLYPYVAPGTATFEQHNWDMDWAGGIMTLHTPMRDIVVDNAVSWDNEERSSSYGVQTGEGGATWTVTLDFFFTGAWNDATFWAVGDGVDLAIFTHPTMAPPP